MFSQPFSSCSFTLFLLLVFHAYINILVMLGVVFKVVRVWVSARIHAQEEKRKKKRIREKNAKHMQQGWHSFRNVFHATHVAN